MRLSPNKLNLIRWRLGRAAAAVGWVARIGNQSAKKGMSARSWVAINVIGHVFENVQRKVLLNKQQVDRQLRLHQAS